MPTFTPICLFLLGIGVPSNLVLNVKVRILRKLWYIYTMEYYSAIKKKTFESVLMRWMKLEPIIQSKPERKTLIRYTNAYIWNLERW